MARSRCTLHCDHVEEFTEFLKGKGHSVEPPKGDYEVFRARIHGQVFPVYTRAATHRGNTPVHLTVYGEVYKMTKEFYREKHKDENHDRQA